MAKQEAAEEGVGGGMKISAFGEFGSLNLTLLKRINNPVMCNVHYWDTS